MDAGMVPTTDQEVGNSQDRHTSLTGEESDLEIFAQWQEKSLLPLKEDIADWLNKTLDIDLVSAENFLEVLDNGVFMCKLAHIIQVKAQEASANGNGDSHIHETLPKVKIKYKPDAKSGTWFARDNVANFIQWCKGYGVKSECLFETEGLVLHKEPRTVILCLLELARLGAKYGIEPPNLVKLENEIDNESQSTSAVAPIMPKEPTKRDHQRPQSGRQRKKSSSSASSKSDELDKQVRLISGCCNCSQCYQVSQISEGRYNIGGKNMFVRLLKGKHVMVRVGGGWDTLQHYLVTHDPCKVFEFKRTGPGKRTPADDKFLYIHSSYKQSS